MSGSRGQLLPRAELPSFLSSLIRLPVTEDLFVPTLPQSHSSFPPTITTTATTITVATSATLVAGCYYHTTCCYYSNNHHSSTMNLPSLVHQPRHQSHYLQPMHRLEHCEFPDAHQMPTVPYSHRAHGYAHPPAPPPSPPVEDNSKCSLPPISTILVFADAGTPNGTGKPMEYCELKKPQEKEN